MGNPPWAMPQSCRLRAGGEGTGVLQPTHAACPEVGPQQQGKQVWTCPPGLRVLPRGRCAG
eukprot:3777875-Alexandrium_andersonii.AAC.1